MGGGQPTENGTLLVAWLITECAVRFWCGLCVLLVGVVWSVVWWWCGTSMVLVWWWCGSSMVLVWLWWGRHCVQRASQSSFCPSSAATLTTPSYLQNCPSFPLVHLLSLPGELSFPGKDMLAQSVWWANSQTHLLVGAEWKCVARKDHNRYLWDNRHIHEKGCRELTN